MNRRTKEKPELSRPQRNWTEKTRHGPCLLGNTCPAFASPLGPPRNPRSLPRHRKSLLPDPKSQAPPPNRKQGGGRPLPAAAPCAGAVAYLWTGRSRLNRDAVRKRHLHLARSRGCDVRETMCAGAVNLPAGSGRTSRLAPLRRTGGSGGYSVVTNTYPVGLSGRSYLQTVDLREWISSRSKTAKHSVHWLVIGTLSQCLSF